MIGLVAFVITADVLSVLCIQLKMYCYVSAQYVYHQGLCLCLDTVGLHLYMCLYFGMRRVCMDCVRVRVCVCVCDSFCVFSFIHKFTVCTFKEMNTCLGRSEQLMLKGQNIVETAV